MMVKKEGSQRLKKKSRPRTTQESGEQGAGGEEGGA